LTAEILTAAKLKELGLIHEVVAGELLDAACTGVTEALLKGAPLAQAEAKALIRDVANASAANRAAVSAEAARRLARLRVKAEAQEGFSAFFAKRKASWRKDGA
jgi:methylglutaconyl-CoA hydratase